MPITTALCNSYKAELAQALHDFTASTGHAFKAGLFKASPSGSYGASTTNYSQVTGNSDEASGTGYSAGGGALTNITPALDGGTAHWQFSNVVWSSSTISADGAFFYNTSSGNRMVFVYSFGSTKASSAADFTLTMPTNDGTTGLLRLA